MDLKILVSQKAQINKRDYHTFSYDEKFECMNCNCVEYLSSEKKISYGIILNFINFKDHNFCVIKKFIIKNTDKLYSFLSEVCLKHINKFFLFVTLGYDLELVICENIKRRCILVQLTNEAVISPCIDLDGPD